MPLSEQVEKEDKILAGKIDSDDLKKIRLYLKLAIHLGRSKKN